MGSHSGKASCLFLPNHSLFHSPQWPFQTFSSLLKFPTATPYSENLASLFYWEKKSKKRPFTESSLFSPSHLWCLLRPSLPPPLSHIRRWPFSLPKPCPPYTQVIPFQAVMSCWLSPLSSWLWFIFNHSLSAGCFPIAYKHASVSSILKIPSSISTSYHLTSVFPFVAKIHEKSHVSPLPFLSLS